MNLKIMVAAAALAVGLTTTATAMPLDKLTGLSANTIETEQVRLVCNRWGRCWRTGYRAYGYGYGGGWRRHHHRRWW